MRLTAEWLQEFKLVTETRWAPGLSSTEIDARFELRKWGGGY
jgi:hypothetical protein